MKIDDSSRQAVLTRLKPHLPTLGQCFRAAWEHWTEWLKRPDGPPSGVSARSRASVLYDFIVKCLPLSLARPEAPRKRHADATGHGQSWRSRAEDLGPQTPVEVGFAQ